MTLTLNQYMEKHGYVLIEEYTTIGGDYGSNHRRAIVADKITGERFHLYYDRSYTRRSLAKQQRDYHKYTEKGLPVPIPQCRGWRNITLYNQRRRDRVNARIINDIMPINDDIDYDIISDSIYLYFF